MVFSHIEPEAVPAPAEQDPRWPLVLGRNAAADGTFVYAVQTTGIYCRPSCPSRRAHARHVRFFSTGAEAAAAGYRACLRCRPEMAAPAEAGAAQIARACQILAEAEAGVPLARLAASVGMSAFHFHRRFKAITGLTPKAYGAALRAARLRAALPVPGQTITQAIYGAGFGSSSRFYEKSREILGMTPTAFQNGGAGAAIVFAVGQCSLGALLVARGAAGVCAIMLGDDPSQLVHDLEDQFPNAVLSGDDPGFTQLVARVAGLVEAPGLGLDLPLDLRGTVFQKRVWTALRMIPAGETMSYAELAQRIGEPKAVRAVARACGANKIAVAIPCHRVIRTDGSLSGYRWGIARKQALLGRERG